MRDMSGKNNPNRFVRAEYCPFFDESLSGSEDADWDWKGGRRDNRKDGYVKIYAPNHPLASKHTKSVFEHRIVMEKHIGRYLRKDEIVHHINGDSSDNRIENLALLKDQKEHVRTHKRKRDKKGRFI